MAYSAVQDQDFATASNDEDAVLSDHGTGDAANQSGYGYLSSTGDFDASTLAGLYGAGPSGEGAWGNTAAPNFVSQYEATPGDSSGAASPAPATDPTGLPTPANVSADAPQPLQSFGATPTVTPTYVDPNNTPQYLAAEEQANATSLAPTFQQQDQTNQDQLAARGISSSGAAAEITNQLQTAQGATLAGMNAPAIQQQSGYQQQDLTGNAASANAATAANAGYYDQAVTGNATTYNNYLSTLEGQGYNTGNEAYTAYLNSFGPNSGVTSSYGGAVSGIGNAATGAYDSSVAGEGAAVGGAFGAAGTAITAGANKA